MSRLLCHARVKLFFCALSLVVLTILTPTAFPAPFGRTWKSSGGGYSIEAEFVNVKDGTVSLRKANGDVIEVPLARLSAEDQGYVAEQAGAADTPSPRKQTYTQLARSARSMHTAAEVLRMYKLFLQHENLAEPDRKAAEKQLPVWEERAKKRMVRVGLSWLEPAEANDLKRQARQLTDEALRLLEAGQDEAAIDKCTKASRLDPDAILADFLLGLGYALVSCNAKDANRHFAECVRRDPLHISALNNLALSEVRLREYTQALIHWQAALEVAPAGREIIQNLGRLLHLAKQERILLPAQIQRRFNDLYAAAAVSADGGKFDGEVGWLYMGYYAPLGEQAVSAKADKNKLVRTYFGTGFVVHPEYILTNRHVVEGCARLLVVPPDDDSRTMPADVVAVVPPPEDNPEGDDLALIHCEGLTAPPLPFIRADLAPCGTEIMTVGFPGKGPDAQKPLFHWTEGRITEQDSRRYEFDALVFRGNSGGPICDATGSVLGVVSHLTEGRPLDYSVGVPHSRAIPLLKKHIDDFRQLPPNTEAKPWPEIRDLARCSTVLIWKLCAVSDGGISRKQKTPKKARPFEDRWCMACFGRGTVKCPAPGCANGTVREYKFKRTAFPDGSFVVTKVPIRVPCKKCRGKGVVRCPDCDRGIDRDLR